MLLLEKAVAPHSSTLAWKLPWTEESGGLRSMGSLRVGHDWVASLSLFTFMHWRRKWQCSCLENPRDGGAWWAAVYGVAQCRTRLKRLSSSSNSIAIGNRCFGNRFEAKETCKLKYMFCKPVPLKYVDRRKPNIWELSFIWRSYWESYPRDIL